jgi:2'-5' RNA ligase
VRPGQEWIEAIRSAHDPQAPRIAAHFTLVFPVVESRETIASVVSGVAQTQPPFDVVIDTVAAVRDPFGDGGHVFLVPSDGAREIRALHDRVYDSVLLPYFRADLPYTPHLTVAASRDFSWCERCAADLSGRLPRIVGRVDRLTIVEIADDAITDAGSFSLQSRT